MEKNKRLKISLVKIIEKLGCLFELFENVKLKIETS